ncbi:Ninja-family protein AFP2 [Bienertia sinuspersici]
MDSSSKLYSTSNSESMGEAVNYNNSSTGIISSSGSSSRHRSKEMENLSFEISKYPRDLLQTFLGTANHPSSRVRSEDPKLGEDEDDEGLNLGLGLSLGGKFGVDKSKNMGLVRSSSIAGTMPLFKDDDMGVAPPPKPSSNLVRTSSLPVETEEEWRKRKEMQTLRRMEAKRRRSEKQRVLKEAGSGSGDDKGGVEGLKLRAKFEREQQCLGITNKLIGSSMGNLFGSSKPPPPSTTNNLEVKGRRNTFGSLQGFLIAQAQAHDQAQSQSQSQPQPQPHPQTQPQPQPQPQPLPQPQSQPQTQSQSQPQPQLQHGSSQGSGESQGGTSSDASELESKIHQGSSSCGEVRSPASIHDRESMGPSGSKNNRGSGTEVESLSKQAESNDNKRKETAGSSGIEDMPCVFTIGDGPHGRKVEGILYKYGKGAEVRIMCVCHGNFFSPSEFVKHAGGRDVDHPLRHIVVSPSTSAFQ